MAMKLFDYLSSTKKTKIHKQNEILNISPATQLFYIFFMLTLFFILFFDIFI